MIDAPDTHCAAWGCTSCGGVWAGIGAANRVVSILDPAVRDLAVAAETLARAAPPQRRTPPLRRCPDCNATLAFREVGGVTVDFCAEHGTWFDRGELQRVADERLGKKPEADPSSARWKPDVAADVAADVAVGASGLFFEVLDS